MPDLVIFGLFGMVAGFAYINYLLKKNSISITSAVNVLNNEEQETAPNYEESQMQPPIYVREIEQAPPPY
jgi:hypothetical protein